MQNLNLQYGKLLRSIFLVSSIIVAAACKQTALPASAETIRVQVSYTAQPWITKLDNCSGETVILPEIRAMNYQDLQTTDLVMQLGQPQKLISPAYQVGADDLLVIVSARNPVENLTHAQVKGIFTGQVQTWKSIDGISAPVQVWVFSPGEDIQDIFSRSILSDGPVSTNARLANDPTEMTKAVADDEASIGLITRTLKTDDTKAVFTIAKNLPVLVIPRPELDGVFTSILNCMQKDIR